MESRVEKAVKIVSGVTASYVCEEEQGFVLRGCSTRKLVLGFIQRNFTLLLLVICFAVMS